MMALVPMLSAEFCDDANLMRFSEVPTDGTQSQAKLPKSIQLKCHCLNDPLSLASRTTDFLLSMSRQIDASPNAVPNKSRREL